ncbi:MAG: leader peptidase (prepilin peptidase) / N-methyltransferase [Candidatus Frackibacter sp. T328-2]|nr:MAG: leader peptidase (prepilin peptidase) / N-methyltransferase [Candidatus Frackibacter sp. T328-2]
MFIPFTVFIYGLLIGSFLNVVIYRLPNDESIIFPRSHCPNCQTKLGVMDLIPIISFVFNKGRCRYCQTKISWQYPLVELLTGIFFAILFIQYQFSINFWIYAFLTILLIICTFIDYKHQIIPNKITYSGIIIGLILSILFKHITFQSALLGILIPGGFLLLVAIITNGGMGIGDVKFAVMIGTYIGAKYTLIGIFIGSLVGSVLGLGLICLGLKERKSRIPFGPLIALGNILMLLWGEEVVGWYLGI